MNAPAMPSTRQLYAAVITGSTCGPACWHAAEEVCHCSCGGKNHGIMRFGGEQPERTCKIDGRFYRLEGIGSWLDIRTIAYDYNNPINPATGQRDYSHWRQAGEQAIDRPATASQQKWPEVINSGMRQPSLLWVPINAPRTQAEPAAPTSVPTSAVTTASKQPALFAL